MNREYKEPETAIEVAVVKGGANVTLDRADQKLTAELTQDQAMMIGLNLLRMAGVKSVNQKKLPNGNWDCSFVFFPKHPFADIFDADDNKSEN